MGYYIYSNYWRTLPIEYVDGYSPVVMKKDRGRTLAYQWTGPSYVYGSESARRAHWGVIVNSGTRLVTFELVYKISSIQDKWKTIGTDIVSKLFKKSATAWDFGDKVDVEWSDNTHVLDVGGRALFQYDTNFIKKKIWGLNKDTIRSTMLAKLIEGYEEQLGVAVVYGDCIKNFEDATIVFNSVKILRDVGWKIWKNKFSEARDELMTKISEEKKQLESLNEELQTCTEGAAEALNRLSMNFGIDVQL